MLGTGRQWHGGLEAPLVSMQPAHAHLLQVVNSSCEHRQAPQAGDGVRQVPLGVVQLCKQQLHVAGGQQLPSRPTVTDMACWCAAPLVAHASQAHMLVATRHVHCTAFSCTAPTGKCSLTAMPARHAGLGMGTAMTAPASCKCCNLCCAGPPCVCPCRSPAPAPHCLPPSAVCPSPA